MPRFSDTQAILLSAAAARTNLNVLPVPDTIRLKGGALDRTVRALLDRGFITDGTGTGATAQPTTGGNRLVITPKGLAAIGVEVPEAGSTLSGDGPGAGRSTDTVVRPDRPGGKLGVLLDAVARPTGATLDEGASYVWGAAEDDYDGRASARLTGPSRRRCAARALGRAPAQSATRGERRRVSGSST